MPARLGQLAAFMAARPSCLEPETSTHSLSSGLCSVQHAVCSQWLRSSFIDRRLTVAAAANPGGLNGTIV